jgi:hypothetical protein
MYESKDRLIFFNKVTTHLVTTSKFILVEKLNIKSMTN